jgi:hypothetical protein
MIIPRIDQAKRGGQITADELNRAFEVIERLTNITASPPLRADRGHAGFHIAYDEPARFPVQITSSNGLGAYGWKEQLYSGNGIYIDRPGGRVGTLTEQPAYENNLNVGVPIGTIVEIHPGWFNSSVGQEWQFSYLASLFFIWAMLTGYDFSNKRYAWHQQQPIAIGAWQNMPGGLIGTLLSQPAYEANGQILALGSIVQLWPGYSVGGVLQDWRFDQCCPLGAGSGSGTGGTVNLGGCTGISTSLYATITNTTGCDCLDGGTVPVFWNGSTWTGTAVICGVTVTCTLSYSGGSWIIALDCAGTTATGGGGLGAVCSPFEVTASAMVLGVCTCCPAGGTFGVSFTA